MNYALLRTLRRRQGLTQIETAQSVGVSRQALSNYERGLREPSLKSLIIMSDLYKVSLDELVGRTKPEKAN